MKTIIAVLIISMLIAGHMILNNNMSAMQDNKTVTVSLLEQAGN